MADEDKTEYVIPPPGGPATDPHKLAEAGEATEADRASSGAGPVDATARDSAPARPKPLPAEGTETQSKSAAKRSGELSKDLSSAQDVTLPQQPSEVLGPHKLGKDFPKVPGYEILERLGQGSYGEVWRAREARTGIEVAVKFLTHGAGLQWQLLQAEVKQLAMLHADPGIVQLIDVEPAASPPYYIMEYVQQGSLSRRLENGPLPVAEALDIFSRLAEALAYVHAKGIRHCDLKPGNVLLDSRGRARLADFGQAHLSSDASPALGTFFYMAPEQADLSKQIPDTRWDVYGLGALFYTMVTGRPPRENPSIRDHLARTEELAHRLQRYRDWVQSAPEPGDHRRAPGMDRHLADIISRCLAVDPARRLPDAAAVLAALERRQRLRRQRPLLVFGFAAPLLLVLILAGVGTWLLNTSIQRSQDALGQQLEKNLESDLVLARVIAKAVEGELLDIVKMLEANAGRGELRQTLRDADRKKLTGLLQEAYKKNRPDEIGRWVVTDRHGKLLACFPIDETIYDRDFSWRDWFNGTGDHLEKKPGAYPPLRQTHVSQPFVGKSTGHPLAIAVATPIWEGETKGRVAGVLMVTVLLDEVYSWLDERVKLQNGFIVLINDKGQYLHHRDREAIKPKESQNPPRYDCQPFRDVLAGKEGSTSYEDPLDGKTYLIGYAPLQTVAWGALVQHDREAALQPIHALKEDLSWFFWLGLFTVGTLISALWGALIFTLRRSSRQESISPAGI